jgi:excisionase family DNA binding protein
VQRRTAYTASELASELGVHKASIYRWIARGLLRADTSVGFTLIPLDEALRFSREGPPR